MAYYTNITLFEANTILALYDLPKAINLQPIGHGISNSNYIATLEDQREIILKISNDKNHQELLEEQYILLNLNKLGFYYSPVPLLTKLQSPVYITPPFHGVLFPRFQGHVPTPSEDVCWEIGANLAQLHVATSPDKLHNLPYPLRYASDVSYFPEDLVQFCQHPQCPQEFQESVFQHLPDDLLAFYMSLEDHLPRAILHGDLYYDNTLFRDKKLVGMLDFEQAGLGPCLFDIGVSISGTCLKDQKIVPHFVLSFLKGYQSIRSLTSSEVELLPMHILCGFLSIALWRVHRFYLGNLSSARKMSYQELLVRAEETSTILTPKWYQTFVKAGS